MPIVVAQTNTIPGSVLSARTDRLAKPWSLSDRGLAFLKIQESGVLNGRSMFGHVTDGYILTVYPDSVGIPTVGLGHKVLPEDHLHLGDTISLERARSISERNIAEAVNIINRKVMVPLYQYEFDALVDLTFNCGVGAFASHVAPIVNAGNYLDSAEFIKTFRAGRGNRRRRIQESDTFKTGSYDASH